MHLGRFNYFIWELRNYFTEQRVKENLDSVVTALSGYVNSPIEEQSKAFRGAVDKFRETAGSTPKELLLPTAQEIFADASLSNFYGDPLVKSLDSALSSSLTPQEMLTNVSKLSEALAKKIGYVEAISGGLSELEVEYEAVETGEFEFGYLLPREILNDELRELTKELEQFDKLLRAFNYINGRGDESPKVRTISSSWWQFFFELDPVQISALTFAIERIVALYKNGLDIRKTRIELERLGETETAQKLDDRIQIKIKEGIDALATEMREKYKKINDEAMLNDYTVKLKFQLSHLARRIDQGARAEVRVGIPNKPKEPKAPDENQPEQVLAYEPKKIKYDEDMAVYVDSLRIANEVLSMSEHLADQLSSIGNDAPLQLTNDEANEQMIKPPLSSN
jgi:hypothetical protein